MIEAVAIGVFANMFTWMFDPFNFQDKRKKIEDWLEKKNTQYSEAHYDNPFLDWINDVKYLVTYVAIKEISCPVCLSFFVGVLTIPFHGSIFTVPLASVLFGWIINELAIHFDTNHD